MKHPLPDLHQSEGLTLARQQSQALARSREKLAPSWRWERVLAEPTRSSRREVKAWAWSLVVGLLLICAGTGTWAFIQRWHRVQPSRKAPPTSVSRSRVFSEPSPTQPARSGLARVKSRSVVEKEPRRNKPRSTIIPQLDFKAKSSASPDPSVVPSSSGQVVFDPSEMPGGGEMIIVNPPRKLEPLFSPEEFKKRGLRGSGR
jgi:hypothetical protein